jgi:hypothetical protein
VGQLLCRPFQAPPLSGGVPSLLLSALYYMWRGEGGGGVMGSCVFWVWQQHMACSRIWWRGLHIRSITQHYTAICWPHLACLWGSGSLQPAHMRFLHRELSCTASHSRVPQHRQYCGTCSTAAGCTAVQAVPLCSLNSSCVSEQRVVCPGDPPFGLLTAVVHIYALDGAALRFDTSYTQLFGFHFLGKVCGWSVCTARQARQQVRLAAAGI